MTKEFVLDIEGTGVLKHMTFNMTITWKNEETEESEDVRNRLVIGKIDDEFITAIKEKEAELKPDDEYKGPVIILNDGIKEWCEATLEFPVYGRCKAWEDEVHDGPGGPELVFSSEGDRAAFILKWL